MKQVLQLSVFIFFTCSCFHAVSQAPPVLDWQECLGGNGLDIPNKIIHSDDGGYIVAGSTNSTNGNVVCTHGGRDIWVLKTNSAGSIQWQKSYGGQGSDFASALVQLTNGDIVVAGYTSSVNGNVTGNHGSLDEWLIRLDASGNLIWQKTIGGSSADICNSMALCPDGGFILGGSSASTNGNVTGNHGGKDFWIVKTDSAGNLQWQKSLGGSGTDECYVVQTTGDGGYLATGYTNSNDFQVSGNHGGFDYWAVKLDANGNLLWQKCLGGSANEVATVSLQNLSGDFLIGGYSNSSDGDVTDNHGSSDYWLVRLDSANGNILSERSYGGSYSDIAFDLIITADGGYLLAGASTSNDFDVSGNHGGEDFWLVKTDSAGNIRWARTYGGSGNDRPSSVVQSADGGFSVIGYTYSNNIDVSGNHGGADTWFLKLSCFTPVAAFTTSSDTVCVLSPVNFTNASVHSAQYEWRINDIPFSQNTNASFQFYAAGIYKISLISFTCYETDTTSRYMTVVNYPVPSIASSNSFLCPGNSATLSTIPADSYAWNTGETTPFISVDSGGVFSVVVTTNGCSASATFSIPDYSTPAIDLGNNTSICSGASVTLHASPGYQSYLWQDGSSDSTLTVFAGGLYAVTVSNGHCSTSDSVQVSIISNPVPSISSSSSYLCEGNTAVLSTIAADSYSWNNGESTSSISIDSGGTYSVTVTTNGCSGSASFTIAQHSTPIVNLGNDTTICTGSSIILHAPSGYLNYFWQDGSADSIFTVNTDGWYFVNVNNGYCSSGDSIQVLTVPCSVLTANFITNQTSICANSCIDFTDNSLNASSWNWFFPGSLTPFSNQQNPTNICYSSPGTYSVGLIVHGINGASNGMMRFNYITVSAPPVASVTSNGTFLTCSYSASYQWLYNAVPIPAETLQTYNALQTGYYSVLVTDVNGCSSVSDSVYMGITGISNPLKQTRLRVFPNPSKGIFTVSLDNFNQKSEIEVADVTGKILIHYFIDTSNGTSFPIIDLSDFSNGVYFLHVKTPAGKLNEKLILEK